MQYINVVDKEEFGSRAGSARGHPEAVDGDARPIIKMRKIICVETDLCKEDSE